MRKIKECLRLRHAAGLSYQRIADSLRLSVSTVHKYVQDAAAVGVRWPLPEGLDEAELERRLYACRNSERSRPQRAQPEWEWVHQELRRKGVTLQLLWEEYRAQDPAHSYGYAQFCKLYGGWRTQLKRSLRQTHRAGEKLFIDYAGPTVEVIDRETGAARGAQVFVAVLGASNYTYCEATWTQGVGDWCGSHVRAFEFFGGVPEVIVPDNLKAAVTKASRYEPDLNPTYAELAAHYGCAVMPARPRRPKDKAKAEVGVQIVERWILARLRRQTFFSLHELNAAIAALLAQLNAKPFKRLPGCRRSQFEQLDRPALRPLPTTAFAAAEWRQARVGADYHLAVDGHYYSVPHQLCGRQLDVRVTGRMVECFHRGQRVAAHVRAPTAGGSSTLPEHQPPAHRRDREWTPEKLRAWAGGVGPAAAQAVEQWLTGGPHPQPARRRCLGLVSLARHYGPERLEVACRRALALGCLTHTSLAAMLRRGLEQAPLPSDDPCAPATPPHDNIRGPAYYQ